MKLHYKCLYRLRSVYWILSYLNLIGKAVAFHPLPVQINCLIDSMGEVNDKMVYSSQYDLGVCTS